MLSAMFLRTPFQCLCMTMVPLPRLANTRSAVAHLLLRSVEFSDKFFDLLISLLGSSDPHRNRGNDWQVSQSRGPKPGIHRASHDFTMAVPSLPPEFLVSISLWSFRRSACLGHVATHMLTCCTMSGLCICGSLCMTPGN